MGRGSGESKSGREMSRWKKAGVRVRCVEAEKEEETGETDRKQS